MLNLFFVIISSVVDIDKVIKVVIDVVVLVVDKFFDGVEAGDGFGVRDARAGEISTRQTFEKEKNH